ncbi:MAG: hypothetical protein NWR72_18810 [Bacteroidia bacterium]|nr:hypothetical protein [Bacteroidia bacterium]
MGTIVALFMLYIFIRGLVSLAPAPAKKPDKGKCKVCGVTIEADEDTCWHCEIVEYRLWKKKGKK